MKTLTKQILVLASALALVLFGSVAAPRAYAFSSGYYYPGERCVNRNPGMTPCRIEIAANEAVVDGDAFDQRFRRLLIHTPWQGQGIGQVYDPFGPSPTAVFFLARDGNALPQPTP